MCLGPMKYVAGFSRLFLKHQEWIGNLFCKSPGICGVCTYRKRRASLGESEVKVAKDYKVK